MRATKYQPGARFGAWTLLAFVEGSQWAAQCDCSAIQQVWLSHLTSGKSTRCKACYTVAEETHGRSMRDPTYNAWSHMKAYCGNPANSSYPNYGARGLTVDPTWMDFSIFLADMGERPIGYYLSLRSGQKVYGPGCCYWEPPRTALARVSVTDVYEYDGKALTVSEWAAQALLPAATLRGRLQRHWSICDAITLRPGERR